MQFVALIDNRRSNGDDIHVGIFRGHLIQRRHRIHRGPSTSLAGDDRGHIDHERILCHKVGVDQSLFEPVVHLGQIFSPAIHAGAPVDLAGFIQLPGRPDAITSGHTAVHGIKAVEGQAQRCISAQLILESGQCCFPFIEGGGNFHTKLIQPVFTHLHAVPGALFLGVNSIDTSQPARVSLGVDLNLRICQPQGLVVGHVFSDLVGQIHKVTVVDTCVQTVAVIVGNAIDHIGNLVGSDHQVEVGDKVRRGVHHPVNMNTCLFFQSLEKFVVIVVVNNDRSIGIQRDKIRKGFAVCKRKSNLSRSRLAAGSAAFTFSCASGAASSAAVIRRVAAADH